MTMKIVFIVDMTGAAEKIFIDYLSRKGLTVTPQRKVIAETFLETEGHFSAEKLYGIVCVKYPEIGQATVYRTLKLLVDSGLADSLDLGEEATLYEHAYGHRHHDHLICVNCGCKVEFYDDEIERRQEKLAKANGYTLTRHRMSLYGLCENCRNKLK
ncbi:transcriptional repressor [Maridesulfovibrio sp.]|uniref:Fur family transcriptional regulator n=1 Tax=Maridesulfovibrio sp. TaxID=2795000 RepID=UPI002A18A0A7|nr:transcriptional repressor [Maridesulfovibrio sp.]